MSGRDTGLQVIHYLAAEVRSETFNVLAGLHLGDMPAGAIITDVDVTVLGSFGADNRLRFGHVPGVRLFSMPSGEVGKFKLPQATVPLPVLEAIAGGPIYVWIADPPAPGGWLRVVLSYAPSLG